MGKVADDERLDPRIRSLMGLIPDTAQDDIAGREALLTETNAPSAVEGRAAMQAFFDSMDNDDVAPAAGLTVTSHEFTSSPDGNTVKLQLIRPDGDEAKPCVYYIHGGGMMTMSAFDGMYRAWGKIIAAQGVAVAMVDFRNCLTPSSAPEVEPFPAGLDDCVAGLRWTIDNATTLGIDPGRVVVAGESGGGNLSIATTMTLVRGGDVGLIRGLYSLCPFIAGEWPQDRFPSSIENNGILLNLHNNRARVAYGIGEFETENPLAWPSFASEDDVAGFPPTVISVNECDPLRDEGVEFYRLLLRAGVPARCRQVMGTAHGTEIFAIACPDISRETASSIAHFVDEVT